MPTILSIVLPTDYEQGGDFGPDWSTVRLEAPSGFAQHIQRWTYPRHFGSISYVGRDAEELEDLRSLHYACAGGAYGFLFWDHKDNAGTDENIGTGDGAQTVFQLRKLYTLGGIDRYRKITRPVHGALTVEDHGATLSDTVTISVAGVPTVPDSIDEETGLVTLTAAPTAGQAVTASFRFVVPCSFVEDHMPITMAGVFANISGWQIREERE